MTKEADRLMDDLRDMTDTEFSHVYEMTKRAACVRFDVEAYTVGYQDAFAARPEENGFVSALNRKYYDMGYREGARRRCALAGVTP
jgi:hypothetical protein